MSEFKIHLTTAKVDIKNSNGFIDKGWVSIKITKEMLYIYIARDNNRIYWIGRKVGLSAGITITFNDIKKMIKVNSANKIYFHNSKDYEKLRKTKRKRDTSWTIKSWQK